MKRPNKTGSVIKLSGKRRRPYAVRVFDGIELKEDGNGKLKYKYLGYFEKQIDALQFLEKYNSTPVTLAKPKVETNKHKFSEIYKMYIDELHVSRDIGEHSYKVRKSAYNNLKPLHNMIFENLTLEDIEKEVRKFSDKSASTITNIKVVLRGMYKTALRHKYVSEDLSALIIAEHARKPINPHTPFTKEEIDVLWAHSESFYCRVYLILIYTGMRANELFKMKSKDVFMDERYMVGGSKTAAGKNRKIPIADKIIPLLDTSGEYLIMQDGKPLKYKQSWDRSNKELEELGMAHTFHDARHTCSTLLEKAKVPPLHIKRILGHSSNDITDRYTHVEVDDLITDINKI